MSILPDGPFVVKLSDEERETGNLTPLNMLESIDAFFRDGLVVIENAVEIGCIDRLNERMKMDTEELLKNESKIHWKQVFAHRSRVCFAMLMPRCLNQPGTSKRQCFTEPTLRERSNWIEKTAVTRLIVFRFWESRIHVPTDLRESSCRRHHGQHPRTSPTGSLHPYQHLGRQHSQSSGCPQSLSSLFPLGHSLADQSLSHRTAHSITCVIHSTWLSTSA